MRLSGLCDAPAGEAITTACHIAFQYGVQIVKDALALKFEIELVRAYPRTTAKIQRRPPLQIFRVKRADISTAQDADTRLFIR